MIRTYFNMKVNEWKVKAQFFGIIASFMDNHKEVTELVKNLYGALKDTEPDKLQEMLVTKIVELVNDKE